MQYRLAVFDMDGTILNTLDDLCDSVNVILERYGAPKRSLQEVCSFVGNGIFKLVERAFPARTTPQTLQEAYEQMIAYYADHSREKTAPYEGIVECLGQIRAAGMKTAVVSNKVDFAVKELADVYFKGLFDCAVGLKDGIPPKPAPDGVLSTLKELQISANEAVYIGDSEVDLATAQNAGLPALAVAWGFRKPAFLKEKGAKIICNTPKELTTELLK